MPMLTMVRMRSPGGARPRAVADLLGERAGPPEHLVDLGHDVLAVDLDHRARRRPQRHVQHRAVLGDVDPLAGEHGVAAGLDAGDVGDGQQRGHHVVVDALLGVVDAQVTDVQQVALGPAGIGGEQLPEVGRLRGGQQGRPLRRGRDVGAEVHRRRR